MFSKINSFNSLNTLKGKLMGPSNIAPTANNAVVAKKKDEAAGFGKDEFCFSKPGAGKTWEKQQGDDDAIIAKKKDEAAGKPLTDEGDDIISKKKGAEGDDTQVDGQDDDAIIAKKKASEGDDLEVDGQDEDAAIAKKKATDETDDDQKLDGKLKGKLDAPEVGQDDE